jgi:hypothetical protein
MSVRPGARVPQRAVTGPAEIGAFYEKEMPRLVLFVTVSTGLDVHAAADVAQTAFKRALPRRAARATTGRARSAAGHTGPTVKSVRRSRSRYLARSRRRYRGGRWRAASATAEFRHTAGTGLERDMKKRRTLLCP